MDIMGNNMTGINGYRLRSRSSLIIVVIDSVLILLGVLLGTYVRFWGSVAHILEGKHPTLKMILVLLVIQMAFYYFDLYDLKSFRERKKMFILLLGSLGVSSIFLALVYYLVPILSIGRGILGISLSLIFLFTFFWRFLYGRLSKSRAFKEKILIIGTGELAKRIKKEILDNGNDAFEIIGFIDETQEKVGKRI